MLFRSARVAWEISSLFIPSSSSEDFFTWFSSVLQFCIEDDFCLVCMVIWSLWQSRNSLVWRNVHESTSHIISRARTFYSSWMEAQAIVSSFDPKLAEALGIWEALSWLRQEGK